MASKSNEGPPSCANGPVPDTNSPESPPPARPGTPTSDYPEALGPYAAVPVRPAYQVPTRTIPVLTLTPLNANEFYPVDFRLTKTWSRGLDDYPITLSEIKKLYNNYAPTIKLDSDKLFALKLAYRENELSASLFNMLEVPGGATTQLLELLLVRYGLDHVRQTDGLPEPDAIIDCRCCQTCAPRDKHPDKTVTVRSILPSNSCTAVTQVGDINVSVCLKRPQRQILYCGIQRTPRYLCAYHFGLAKSHQICPCDVMPPMGSITGFKRCIMGHLWHSKCSETCPHGPCQLPHVPRRPLAPLFLNGPVELSDRNPHIAFGLPTRFVGKPEDLSAMTISKVWSMPNLLHQTHDVLVSRVRPYTAAEMSVILRSLFYDHDSRVEYSPSLLMGMAEQVRHDHLFPMLTSSANQFCRGCRPIVNLQLTLAAHNSIMPIEDMVEKLNHQKTCCDCGDSVKESKNVSKLFTRRLSTCNGNQCQAVVANGAGETSQSCTLPQMETGIYRQVRGRSNRERALEFLCYSHTRETRLHRRCPTCGEFPSCTDLLGTFAECPYRHLFHLECGDIKHIECPHKPCVLMRESMGPSTAENKRIEGSALLTTPQLPLNYAGIKRTVVEMSSDGALRPAMKSPGYEVLLFNKNSADSGNLMALRELPPDTMESHLFRCGSACRRTTRYYFGIEGIIAKERCQCITIRKQATIYLPRSEIVSIMDQFQRNHLEPLCRCELDCGTLNGRGPNWYRHVRPRVTFVHNVRPESAPPAAEPIVPQSGTPIPVVEERPKRLRAAAGRFGSTPLLTLCLMALALFCRGAEGFNMTACDCSSPSFVGTINLGKFSRCQANFTGLRSRQVTYQLYENRTRQHLFPGFVCRAVKWGKRVDTFWTGATDTTSYQHPMALSEYDCWRMQETKNCDGNPMYQSGKVWKFAQEPVASWRYLRTVETVVTQCIVEEITLEWRPETSAVMAVTGKVADDRYAAHGFHQSLTYVWRKGATGTGTNCEVQQVHSGTAQMTTDHVKTAYRLHDVTMQADFFIQPERVTTCQGAQVHPVLGDPFVFIDYQEDPLQHATRPVDTNLTEQVGMTTYLNAHFQWHEAKYLFHIRQLAEQIHYLNCMADDAKLDQLRTLSAGSGVLAASELGLPECHSLISYGNNGIIQQCLRVNVSWAARLTKCGAQPKWKNWTINHDGKSLHPATPCYWKRSLVNFEGTIYEESHGVWIPTVVSLLSRRQQLASKINTEVEKVDKILTQSTQVAGTRTFELLGELSGLLSDTGTKSFTEYEARTNEKSLLPVLHLRRYITAFAVTIGVVMLMVLLTTVFYYTRCCKTAHDLVRARVPPRRRRTDNRRVHFERQLGQSGSDADEDTGDEAIVRLELESILEEGRAVHPEEPPLTPIAPPELSLTSESDETPKTPAPSPKKPKRAKTLLE